MRVHSSDPRLPLFLREGVNFDSLPTTRKGEGGGVSEKLQKGSGSMVFKKGHSKLSKNELENIPYIKITYL